MALPPGDHVGPYQVTGLIVAGGMGEVYKVRDNRLDRTVALKILAPHIAGNPVSRQRFEVEARAAAALSHPHICTLHDVGHQPATASEPARDYLVMEYLEGETLGERLVKGPLPPAKAIPLAIQIASALDCAHRAGIVHRDLKPGNVMLTKAGAKLLDFGLAKPSVSVAGSDDATQAADLTTPGIVLGTLHYLAPEQIEDRVVDPRTDIFAFGSLLFEMLTGRKAFEGRSQTAVIAAIVDDSPPSTVLATRVPGLEYVLRRCLAKDPDDRWQTARDLMFALEGLAPVVAAPGVQQSPGLRPITRIAAGLVLVLGAALIAALSWRTPSIVRSANVSRLSIPPPEHTTFMGGYGAPHFALSPDGRRLVFVPTPVGGRTLLWIRDLDSVTARVLTGTDGATYPFWSPDN